MKKKANGIARLRLHKETLRNLTAVSSRDLKGAVGGTVVIDDGTSEFKGCTNHCTHTACFSECRDTDFCCLV